MFRKRCLRCTKKFEKKDLTDLRKYETDLSGYLCQGCFPIVDEQLNLSGNSPERPPQ